MRSHGARWADGPLRSRGARWANGALCSRCAGWARWVNGPMHSLGARWANGPLRSVRPRRSLAPHALPLGRRPPCAPAALSCVTQPAATVEEVHEREFGWAHSSALAVLNRR